MMLFLSELKVSLCLSKSQQIHFSLFPESGEELSDEPKAKLFSDRKTESSVSGPLELHPLLTSETLPTTIVDPTHTYTPTSNPSVTPEDLAAKRTGLIEEFWLKSAEIRKNMGQSGVPVSCDPNTHSSSTGDTIYTSTHTTSDSNLPSHAPCKSGLVNQTSGTLTHSTQTPSETDLQSAYTHSQGDTSSCGSSHLPEARNENVPVKEGNELEEVVDQSSTAHKLGVTLEGQVRGGGKGLNISSSKTIGSQRVSAPDLRFLPLPRSPQVARQKLDLNHSDPTINREILLSSHTIPLWTDLAWHDRQKPHLNRAQSLPPAKVDVLYAGDADESHPCPAVPCYASVTEVSMTSLPTKTSEMYKRALEGRRALSEVPMQVGATEAWQRRSEIEPLEEEQVKKRSLLCSSRKNRKSGNLSGETQQELGKHKSLWKSMFSGYKKEKKRKDVEGYSRTLPSNTSLESRKRMPGFHRTSGKKKKSSFVF